MILGKDLKNIKKIVAKFKEKMNTEVRKQEKLDMAVVWQ